MPNDPLSAADPWRDAVADPGLLPPPVTPQSPAVALVDAKADVTHPEFASGNLRDLSGGRLDNIHGTATAAVAAAPQNGFGMVGVWPGMRVINVPLPSSSISCAASARGITRAVKAGAAVINMSYGSASPCQSEFDALQYATLRGVTLVAAAGNEGDQDNPMEYPASYPHVLTVGAITQNDTPAFFSNVNAALDLVAPGVNIVTAVPIALDDDGTKDGYEVLDGTSFSAPMVAAAAAWVRAVRTELTVDQVAQVSGSPPATSAPRAMTRRRASGPSASAAAMVKRPPIADPKEPNDDIPFVNGKAFSKADSPVFTGRTRTFKALLGLLRGPARRLPAARGRATRGCG